MCDRGGGVGETEAKGGGKGYPHVNYCFAECGPCHWLESFGTQDSAITAAEHHTLDAHTDLFLISSDARSRQMADKRIGHVQLRDERASAVLAPQTPVVEGGGTTLSTIEDELAYEQPALHHQPIPLAHPRQQCDAAP